jgi:hypothetical protein
MPRLAARQTVIRPMSLDVSAGPRGHCSGQELIAPREILTQFGRGFWGMGAAFDESRRTARVWRALANEPVLLHSPSLTISPWFETIQPQATSTRGIARHERGV